MNPDGDIYGLAPEGGASNFAVDSLPALAGAPPVEAAAWSIIMETLEAGRKKFDDYDTQGKGHINVKEAGMLTDWLWGAFHVDNESIANSARKNEVNKVIRALDSHRDQQMYLDQMEKYFTCTAEAVCRFRAKNAQRMATANAMGKFQIMVEEEKMLHDIPFEYTSLALEYADIMKEIAVHLVNELPGFKDMPYLTFKEVGALQREVHRARRAFDDMDDDANGNVIPPHLT